MLEIICPSYGRTGTRSMQLALDLLGFDPCYHMIKVHQDHLETHPQLWLDGYQGRGLAVKEVFDGYKAVADWPAADFYQEILQEYPNAKVILTLRDPDSWWESVKHSIHHHGPIDSRWGSFFLRVLDPPLNKFSYMTGHIATLNMNEEDAKADYVRHIAEIKAHVPADKLLEFFVKDGWEPLCSFLELPVPDVPFPRVNSRKEVQQAVVRADRMCWTLMAATMLSAGLSVGVVTLLGGRRAGMAANTSGLVGGVEGGLSTGLFATVGMGSALTAKANIHRGVNRRQDDFWVDDRGASEHMTGLEDYVPAAEGQRVEGAGGIFWPVAGYGRLRLLVNQGIGNFKSPTRELALQRIGYVPNLGQHNLRGPSIYRCVFAPPPP